jgi:hypothetical protein
MKLGDRIRHSTVPGQVVVAVVAELRVYGFWGCEGRFAELLRILEKKDESVRGVVWIPFVAELARRIWLHGAELAGRFAARYGSVARMLPN